jgi:hypothetical protein
MEKDEPETENRIRNRNSYMAFSKVFDLVTPSQAANVKERKKPRIAIDGNSKSLYSFYH